MDSTGTYTSNDNPTDELDTETFFFIIAIPFTFPLGYCMLTPAMTSGVPLPPAPISASTTNASVSNNFTVNSNSTTTTTSSSPPLRHGDKHGQW
ncbi:hypothetical protein B0H16DRAFT_1899100 [Mycena metata]|uniref:Uncharacterized protein n=1 Tax=Mycena metata TaxID=1033252 RepID=A0AAD7H7P8_9AGAR|nr:hypothetical protein B0H16DRAFT_1899100 [Mycena metata]